jgi:hypothetical protein
MAVPARPVSGNVVDSAWGQVAHDTAVAQDVQAGTLSAVFSAASSVIVALVFPRPFASPPVVVAAGAANNATIIATVGGVTATGCNVIASNRDAASTTGTFAVAWMAYGPRA